MVNLDNKLTVDDLIVEYMMYKVKNGYEPSFSTSEFINFLRYFETKMDVNDVLYDSKELFKRFFDRKNERDWHLSDDNSANPHMDIFYNSDINDYVIKANYKLSNYDKSIINTYFMDNGMSKYDDYMGTAWEIRNIIRDYLANKPKRVIDQSVNVDDKEIMVGQYVVTEIITEIWNEYLDMYIEDHKWPEQCRDICKYLIDFDLANTIGLESIRNNILELYDVLSKRIAILYHQDNNLKISSYGSSYLKRANYELIIKGYEDLMNICFNRYKKALSYDFSSLEFINKNSNDEDTKRLIKSFNSIK